MLVNDKYDTATIASYIMNSTLLKISGTTHNYRICEIEFYMFNYAHKDYYVHCHNEQHSFGNWYFHRIGKSNSYKGGTYKCFDLTLNIDQDAHSYYGILIRSIYDLTNNCIIEGPCKVSDKILSHFECNNFGAFMLDKRGPQRALVQNNYFYFQRYETPRMEGSP